VARVAFQGVSKRFGDVVAVDHLELGVDDGELLVLLGPSGCGKTTALRMVAGLEEPSEGQLVIGDRIVNDIDPKERDVAMVFQTYALYPHLTVAKNIDFPLRQRGIERDERDRKVHEVAATLGLDTLLSRKPAQLSGGQRQRVALARAIVRDPQVFLMDEPLSNLDAALRVQTRADIVALQQRLGTTTLYVTHDQVEAMTMGHRIAVMSGGQLQQVAAPQELYDRPANTFVAGFLGSPGMNLMPGTLVKGADGQPEARVSGGTLPLPGTSRPLVESSPAVTAGVRPEHLRLDPQGSLRAKVTIVELLGAEAHVICHLDDGTRVVVRQGTEGRHPGLGEEVRVAATPEAVNLFAAEDGRRLEVAA